MSRQGVTKKVRFEIFKRDSFTCQYCGRKAPDVVLQVDHITPVAGGGTNDPLNLVTSCEACNGGKGARPLPDDSALAKQRLQLEDLQERREQLSMMLDWQRELLDMKGALAQNLAQYWSEVVPGYALNEIGMRALNKLLKRYSPADVMDAMHTAVTEYVEFVDGAPAKDSVERAWNYVGRICSVRAAEREKPYLRDLLYIRGILRNRLQYLDEHKALVLMERAVKNGVSIDELSLLARDVRNWTQWREGMDALLQRAQGA